MLGVFLGSGAGYIPFKDARYRICASLMSAGTYSLYGLYAAAALGAMLVTCYPVLLDRVNGWGAELSQGMRFLWCCGNDRLQ